MYKFFSADETESMLCDVSVLPTWNMLWRRVCYVEYDESMLFFEYVLVCYVEVDVIKFLGWENMLENWDRFAAVVNGNRIDFGSWNWFWKLEIQIGIRMTLISEWHWQKLEFEEISDWDSRPRENDSDSRPRENDWNFNFLFQCVST